MSLGKPFPLRFCRIQVTESGFFIVFFLADMDCKSTLVNHLLVADAVRESSVPGKIN